VRQHNSYCVQRAEDRTKWICCEDCPVGAYERGAANARAKLLAEVCAWLQDNHIGENRYIADAIKAKFRATDQPKEKS
jgi:hypothetical protein